MAFDYARDATGKIQVDANGIPVQGALKSYGSAYGKWIAGFNNEFAYKHFNLSFLIDGKFGGKIFSGTNWYAYQFGLSKATLPGRDLRYGTNQLYPQDYYAQIATYDPGIFVYDASFIKFY